jgi:starvation-inducible DNA-binding protein
MPIATKRPPARTNTQAAPTAGTASDNGTVTAKAQPLLNQKGQIIQSFGTVLPNLPLALDAKTRKSSVESLNQILADTMSLRDLYKKHHWQTAGPTFYQLHLLFDKHYQEQSELIDAIAERIQVLGGLSIAMASDVAEMTTIPRPPRDREEVPVQLSRLLEAHQILLKEVREATKQAADADDDGTNDLLVSQVLRTNELQVWFLYEHVVDTPLTRAD